MLKKINRISSKNKLEEVKKKGEMKATSLFGLIWLKNDENLSSAPPLRKEGKENGSKDFCRMKFGVIVSKKISKKAVERNQIKRRLMEAVRLNMDIFPEGFRGIFLVKKNILDKNEKEIEECLKKLF